MNLYERLKAAEEIQKRGDVVIYDPTAADLDDIENLAKSGLIRITHREWDQDGWGDYEIKSIRCAAPEVIDEDDY